MRFHTRKWIKPEDLNPDDAVRVFFELKSKQP
jgi:hypothetical protein